MIKSGFVRRLCANVSKAGEKIEQNTIINRHLNISGDGLFYALSLLRYEKNRGIYALNFSKNA